MNSGLECFVLIAKFYQIPVNSDSLIHDLGKSPDESIDSLDIVRGYKKIGLKSKSIPYNKDKIDEYPLPAIIENQDGTFEILAKTDDKNVLIQNTSQKTPSLLRKEDFVKIKIKNIILITKRSSILSSDFKFGFKWFVSELHKYRKYIIDILIASFFIQILALVTPLFFQITIDKVLVHNSLSTLDVLAIGFVLVVLFEVILSGLRTYVIAHTASRIDASLSSKLFNHLCYLPIHYFKSRRVGDTVARMRELENIRNFITSTSVTLIIDLFFTIMFFVVMAYYSWTLTFVVMAGIPFYIIIATVVTPLLRSKLNDKFKCGAENQAYIVESITGIETVKSMSLEPKFSNKWNDNISNYVNTNFDVTHLGNISTQLTSLVNKLTTIGILWFGSQLVLLGDLTIGGLIAFNILSGRVSAPILRISQLWQDFQQVNISVERLSDILNTPVEYKNKNSLKLPQIKGDISINNIKFKYNNDRPYVLDDISLSITSGEIIGIVGTSGSGKSTLTKLIQRLYLPENGNILIDGVDISLVDPAWLRQQIGVVLQENFLFNKSIRENIAIGNPIISDEKIIESSVLAGAHDFIVALPEGYDTILGEQGSGLSGGQKQRIAIARALINNPRILIFDEATSALDYESENIIQKNMKQICTNRTCLIITHRLNSVKNCDSIIVMKEGKIIERGTHTELLSQNGYYKKLNSYQNYIQE